MTDKRYRYYIGDVCCSRCGGQIEPIETEDNGGSPTFWPGCKRCCCFDYGVTREVFSIASTLVRERHFWMYSHMDRADYEKRGELEYWYEQQIGGTTSIVAQVLALHTDQLTADLAALKKRLEEARTLVGTLMPFIHGVIQTADIRACSKCGENTCNSVRRVCGKCAFKMAKQFCDTAPAPPGGDADEKERG